MSTRPLADQEVLVIDDNDVTRQQVKRHLTKVPPEMRVDHGIGGIKVQLADSVEEATPFLVQATTHPFDLVLLDLSLPKLSRPKKPAFINGFNLLRLIQTNKYAKGIVVISNYPDYKNMRQGFTGGAIDFIEKPLKKQTVQPAVINALTRVMLEESDRQLTQRIFDLVAHAQLGLAHGFRQVFFTLLNSVAENAENIERYAHERYGLDRTKDPNDSMTLLLNTHEQAISKAREDWSSLQAELPQGNTGFATANVSDVLGSIKTALQPSLVVKKLVLTLPKRYEKPVHTFEQDVSVVLREIVAGALSTLSNDGELRTMKVRFVPKGTRLGVIFEDDLDPIPGKQMQAINKGTRILPDAKFGRAWGLSVAQHVALRGGGELKITTERGKNVVTYYIPLADHD